MRSEYDSNYRDCKIKTQKASRQHKIEGEVKLPDGSYIYIASQDTKLSIYRDAYRLIDDWYDRADIWSSWIGAEQLIAGLERASIGRKIVSYEA